MSLLVPCRDELGNCLLQSVLGRKVRETEPLSLKDAEPLFHLIHPGAMHGGEMELKVGMCPEPSAHRLAMMDADIIAEDMNARVGGGRLLVNVFQEGNEFLLPLAAKTLSDDCTDSGIESGEQVQCTVSLVCMFHPIREVSRLGRLGRAAPGSGLKGSLLID